MQETFFPVNIHGGEVQTISLAGLRRRILFMSDSVAWIRQFCAPVVRVALAVPFFGLV